MMDTKKSTAFADIFDGCTTAVEIGALMGELTKVYHEAMDRVNHDKKRLEEIEDATRCGHEYYKMMVHFEKGFAGLKETYGFDTGGHITKAIEAARLAASDLEHELRIEMHDWQRLMKKEEA